MRWRGAHPARGEVPIRLAHCVICLKEDAACMLCVPCNHMVSCQVCAHTAFEVSHALCVVATRHVSHVSTFELLDDLIVICSVSRNDILPKGAKHIAKALRVAVRVAQFQRKTYRG